MGAPFFVPYIYRAFVVRVRVRAHIRTHTNEINAIYIYFIIIYIRNNVQLYSKAEKEDQRTKGNEQESKIARKQKRKQQHKGKKRAKWINKRAAAPRANNQQKTPCNQTTWHLPLALAKMANNPTLCFHAAPRASNNRFKRVFSPR